MYKKIIIYTGRFQPFGPHHNECYNHLCDTFGMNNVYIVTSDKISADSPWNFNEKVEMMKRYGIPRKYIIMEKSPYKPEFINNFDVDQTQLIVAYGDKDTGRFKLTKKDGTPSYYQPYCEDMKPLSQSGYLYKLPHINIRHNNNELSGTYIREFLKTCDESEFQELFGFFDNTIYELMKKKVNDNLIENILYNNTSEDDIYEMVEAIISTRNSAGYNRKTLPQLNDVPKFITWIHGKFKYKYMMVPVSKLKYSQMSLDTDKISKLLSDENFSFSKPVIISKDYYIPDAHHRIASQKIKDSDYMVNCVMIDLTIHNLIQLLKQYLKFFK